MGCPCLVELLPLAKAALLAACMVRIRTLQWFPGGTVVAMRTGI